MIFAIEPLETSWNEMVMLAADHWIETEGYRHDQPFNPKYERYEAYEKIGCFVQFTARDEGRMVGFCGMYIVPSMHTQCLITLEDTLFLAEEYRGKGRTAIAFHNFIADEMRKRGAIEITMTVPPGGKAARLLEHLDYLPAKVQYSKSLVRADSAHFQPVAVGETSDVC